MAEVLITLGIIGVVAAITLPTLIKNYQKQVWVNQLKKTYSTLNEGFKQIVVSEGCTTLECTGLSEDDDYSVFDFTKAKTKEKFVKTFKLGNVYVGSDMPDNSIYSYKTKYFNGDEANFSDWCMHDESSLVGTTSNGEIISLFVGYGTWILVDINGLKSPNTWGRDIFLFSYFDINDTVMVTPCYSKKWNEFFKNFSSEEERIREINMDCSVTNDGLSGMACAEKIIMDGWKMNY